jgi:diguanylate cyclase (GGDEF)-like protein
MNGASFALLVNIMVAALFAASFAIIARASPSARSALWFSASYGVGMLTPLSLLAIPFAPWPTALGALNYVAFSAALLMMAGALAVFYGRRPRWSVLGAMYGASLAVGWLISGERQDTLSFNLAYQAPFAIATATSAWIILRAGRRTPLEVGLACLYGLAAAHFTLKPFVAVAYGVGRTPSEYVASSYAIASQSATGVLLIAAGLLTLLIVAQGAIAEARRASETDQLTGLLNRRGFDLHCESRSARARHGGDRAAVMLLDLDHFKQINDRFGHAIGDEALRDFAALLTLTAPREALVGRMGGEEFVVFLDGATLETGRRAAETILRAAALRVSPRLPPITVSIGVAEILPEEDLPHAMRRADEALYRAKETGRNRVCVARVKPLAEADASRRGVTR